MKIFRLDCGRWAGGGERREAEADQIKKLFRITTFGNKEDRMFFIEVVDKLRNINRKLSSLLLCVCRYSYFTDLLAFPCSIIPRTV